jgi:nicotinamide-nucleotide amidase
MKIITATILTIGEEILYGHILDTNANFISNAFSEVGIKVVMHLSVGDIYNDILDALKIAEARSDVVVITGGLGPTNDDITKKCLSNYFKSEIKLNQKVFEDLSYYFKKRGFPFTESNQKQAYLPENALVISNEMGTAPGMWFEKDNTIFVSMPGVPHEMKYLVEKKIIPKLTVVFQSNIIYHKLIMTAGIGESWLAEKIEKWESSLPENISLAYLPSYGQVKLRLTARGEDKQFLIDEVKSYTNSLQKYIGQYIYGEDGETIQEAIGKKLTSNKQTLSTVESCTGGYISHLITSVPGSSVYYKGAVIAYSNDIKESIINVRSETLQNFGAVSEETVKEMADGIRKKFKTDYAVATSGIAGPGGGTADKPVGTVWIAIAGPDGSMLTKKLTILKDRLSNIKYSSVTALVLLWQRISEKN